MTDLSHYKTNVRELALKRDGTPVFNASADHAAIIVSQIFETAQHDVSILTGHLAPRIFARDDVLQWTQIFLSDPDHQLRILAKQSDLEKMRNNSAYEAIRTSGNVSLRALPDNIEEQIAYRFVVADDDLYRFEPAKEKCEAAAAFGERVIAPHLKSLFDKLWDAALEVDRNELKVMPSLDMVMA
jgi:hypothetical protein